MRRSGVILLLVFLNVLIFSTFAMAYEVEINRISKYIAEAVAKKNKLRIAVVDFTDLKGNVTEFGRFVAEEFSVTLLEKSEKFQVVDRNHLKSLIKEHKLSESGLVNPKTAKKLGEIAGVDALITGMVTPFGDNIRISVKVLDVSTARLIAAKSGNIAATKGIKALVEGGISGSEAMKPRKISPPAPRKSTSPPVKHNAVWTKELKGFEFYLQSCMRSEETVTLSFIVESKDEDKSLSISRGTRIFDNFGNEYGSSGLVLSNKHDRNWSVGSLLIVNVPTKLIITFKGVSRKAQSIPMFEMHGHGFKFQIRNIHITQ